MSALLLATIFLPLAGALLIWIVGGNNQLFCRQSALVSSLMTLVLAGIVVANYPAGAEPYAVSSFRWLGHASPIDVQFSVGLDGLGLWLFGLTALLVLTSVMISWESITDRPGTYYGLMLLLEMGMLGVFAARDIILFYIFFEFTLIPLFFLIGIWGSEDRRYAAIKFFLFTFAGSMLTFLGLLSIVLWDHSFAPGRMTFSIPELTRNLAVHPLDFSYQLWIFLALFAGFAIKVPLFPLHTWLPLAHTQAPAAGSVLLAGVLLKIGTYGFTRFNLPMLPDATAACAPWILWLSVIGIIYGALVALTQTDLKRLIAYSSVSHLGFCMLGLFALDTLSVQGSVLQMINHGLSTGGLFAVVGMIYDRYHTREIAKFGGICRRLPILTFMMVVFTFSSIGLPGLNGFAGEFAILQGMFVRAWSATPDPLVGQFKTIAVVAVFGVVLGAWYMLWLVERVFFGPLREPAVDHDHAHAAAAPAAAHVPAADSHSHDGHDAHGHADAASALPPSSVRDLSLREVLALAPLIVFMVWIGVDPNFFTSRMSASLDPVALAASQRFEEFYGASAIAPVAGSKQAARQPEVGSRPPKRFLAPFSPPPTTTPPAPPDSAPVDALTEEVARVD
ncbi:MAG TPA: NADH-quinone oxidoreductase subunit M [Pirellulales bacterium]|jgi:NADH-quinone oxidoreductase subunit M|nr:NADH-quinone oxidoreductase subunit M [Pirellulales bacterium]